ncbi:hypothetical protein Ccrd_013164 [Cynara cardunculus var. scolymus]|uniref:Uncharacterized protein n=1 Tax=Cynara cardunculus var. scolymus TaxID=59895 RepID=A0A103YG31_CYNCS|nr:hypothetical protein Ccrd_013164 [Cynara cardunculus var. scolymus]
MEVVTWEASEEFDVGLSPFKDVQRNCEEIGLVNDIETHVIDDTTSYTSNNEIQNDENPGQGISISPGGTNWYTPVVEEIIKPVIGSVYPSLDVEESIYQKYAETSGFEFSYDLVNNTTFKKQFFKLVWNIHLSRDEFESRWMVQTEIHRAAWTCSIKSVNSNEEAETYIIEHLDKRDEKIAEYKTISMLSSSDLSQQNLHTMDDLPSSDVVSSKNAARKQYI